MAFTVIESRGMHRHGIHNESVSSIYLCDISRVFQEKVDTTLQLSS